MISRKLTFTDTRTKSINDSNLYIQDLVLENWPSADVSEKDYSGLTVTLDGEKVDFYRKAFKYHIHQDNQWVKMDSSLYFKDALIASLKRIFNTDDQPVTPAPKATPSALKEPTAPNRVQDVIDHINRKIEFGKANGMSNSNITMLLTLVQELNQYL